MIYRERHRAVRTQLGPFHAPILTQKSNLQKTSEMIRVARAASNSTHSEEIPMVDILHRIGIKAPVAQVYQAIATRDGLANWWTIDTRGESRVGGQLEFVRSVG